LSTGPQFCWRTNPLLISTAAYAVEVGELLRSFNQVGVTVVIATHDEQLAERLKPRRVDIQQGRIRA